MLITRKEITDMNALYLAMTAFNFVGVDWFENVEEFEQALTPGENLFTNNVIEIKITSHRDSLPGWELRNFRILENEQMKELFRVA